ncbi:9468_t:CDS:2, partial [Acaulospora colombiana]
MAASCGNYNCSNGQLCFLSLNGPRCATFNTNLSLWALSPESFPPIAYLGNELAYSENDQCEIFSYSNWSNSDKNWLLQYFYNNWLPSPSISNKLPNGSFVQPLDYLGSCSGNKLENSGLPSLYCSPYGNICVKKLEASMTCNSSNQCISANCGNIPATSFSDGTAKPKASCINDSDTSLFLTSNGTRTIFLTDDLGKEANSGNVSKPRNRERSIDPLSGEGGRVRRSASALLNRNGTLNRSSSIRTLPPYSAVDEVTYQPGVVSTIVNYFFPPGELPPPYESEDTRRILTLSDIEQNSTFGSVAENVDESMIPENDVIITTKDDAETEPVALLEVRSVTIEEETPISILPNNIESATDLHTLPEIQDTEENVVFMQERRESEIGLTE